MMHSLNKFIACGLTFMIIQSLVFETKLEGGAILGWVWCNFTHFRFEFIEIETNQLFFQHSGVVVYFHIPQKHEPMGNIHFLLTFGFGILYFLICRVVNVCSTQGMKVVLLCKMFQGVWGHWYLESTLCLMVKFQALEGVSIIFTPTLN